MSDEKEIKINNEGYLSKNDLIKRIILISNENEDYLKTMTIYQLANMYVRLARYNGGIDQWKK